MDVRFLGHACFTLSDGDTTLLIDPFLTGNPKAAPAADEVDATTLLLTHGHQDHYGDTVAIAKRTGATVVAITEVAGEIGEEGVDVRDCNLGGTASFDWGWVKLVPAWHTSTTPKGTVNTPAGLLISFGGKIVYHLGDTCLFSDLQLVGKRTPIDIALMCIGGHYTMDRHDAVDAAGFVGAKTVIPCHYNTFPPIEADAQAFKADVESADRLERRRARARGDALGMTHAIVLIQAESSALATLGGELADIEGVAEAYSVTGEWDFVAMLRLREQDQLAAGRDRQALAARRRAPDADDGRVRGLLAPRPRGAVLGRQ